MKLEELTVSVLYEKYTPLMRSTTNEVARELRKRGFTADEDEIESNVQMRFLEIVAKLERDLGEGVYFRNGFNQFARNEVRDLSRQQQKRVPYDTVLNDEDLHPAASPEPEYQSVEDFMDAAKFPSDLRRITLKYLEEGRNGLTKKEQHLWYGEAKPRLQQWWTERYGDGEELS